MFFSVSLLLSAIYSAGASDNYGKRADPSFCVNLGRPCYLSWRDNYFLLSYARGENNIWNELESKPGPLASQATALTPKLKLTSLVWTSLSLGCSGSEIGLSTSSMGLVAEMKIIVAWSIKHHFLHRGSIAKCSANLLPDPIPSIPQKNFR